MDNKRLEITFRGILLGIFLAIILAVSNTYLALKIGILTSASIPAAMLSMGILRFFKGSNILENNLVQTAASAGEAIAGGIGYTIPALIIIHYWTHFGYLHNFLIALIGGLLGVLFSVPLRRVLVYDQSLRFPEAQAISKVLMLSESKRFSLKELLSGGVIGALLEFAQSGLQVIASSTQGWFAVGKTLIGFGTGFSATLIGAGYLMGFNIGLSLLIGAVTGWLIVLPILSGIYHLAPTTGSATQNAVALWGNYVRYVGIGSVLTAGAWTLITLLRPIGASLYASVISLQQPKTRNNISFTDKDIPMLYVLMGILVLGIASYYLFSYILPIDQLNLSHHYKALIILLCVIYIIVFGFIFAAIAGYFSGLVGVSASPGSAIFIGAILLSVFPLRAFLNHYFTTMSHDVINNACAIVIMILSVIGGAACITNDNMQDLKVGQIVGSTPWKQQLMLIIGVITASAVIPLLMQLLYSVYGIGGAFPHPGMDPSKMLAAPVPSVLAAISQAVLTRELPVHMLLVGAGIIVVYIFLNLFLAKYHKKLSILGIAIGLYLPLSSSTPLFIGSVFALFTHRIIKKKHAEQITQQESNTSRCVLLACGLVAGAALMDVLLAIPFAISGDPNMLNIMPAHLQSIAKGLGVLSIIGLGYLFYRLALSTSNQSIAT